MAAAFLSGQGFLKSLYSLLCTSPSKNRKDRLQIFSLHLSFCSSLVCSLIMNRQELHKCKYFIGKRKVKEAAFIYTTMLDSGLCVVSPFAMRCRKGKSILLSLAYSLTCTPTMVYIFYVLSKFPNFCP